MAVYRDIHLDPIWECERREIAPEDDARWWVRCEHCDQLASFQRPLWTEDDRGWCSEHVPRGVWHEDSEAFETVPWRWWNGRVQRLQGPPTPQPPPRGRQPWAGPDDADLSNVVLLPWVVRRVPAS